MLTWHEAWCFDCGVLLRKKKQVGGLLVRGRSEVGGGVWVGLFAYLKKSKKGVCSLGVPDF